LVAGFAVADLSHGRSVAPPPGKDDGKMRRARRRDIARHAQEAAGKSEASAARQRPVFPSAPGRPPRDVTSAGAVNLSI
jgi:hypothetical protein